MNLATLKDFIRQGDPEAVRAAIKEHPDLVHTRDPIDDHWDECTALHCAAKHGPLAMVKLLVEAGAEVYTSPLNTYPPIYVAHNNSHFDDRPDTSNIVDYFLHEIPQKADGMRGLGVAINLAARAGWTDIVRKHLEIDPLSIHYRGWIGDTPLHWSSHNGHIDIVEMLLDAGAEIEADEINCYGGKPLHWASECRPEVVKLLVQRGANVNATNDLKSSKYHSITPLLMNALMPDDCAEVTKILIDAGADTSRTYQGKTVAQIAKEKGNEKILSALREAGL